MKLTIEKNALVTALTASAKVVQSRNTIPILANVRLFAGDMLSVCGTDLDIEVTSLCDANIEAQGETTVNAVTLLGIAKKAPSGALIAMGMDGDNLVVSYGRSRYSLATLPPEDFPQMASAEYDASFTIPAGRLSRLFGKVAFCASTEETRYYLRGVYLHNAEGGLRAVATDGHKLAMCDDPMNTEIPGVIVPSGTISALDFGHGDVDVSVSETKIRFKTDAATIVSKVIDGTFPEYTRVLPKNNDKMASLNGDALRSAVDRVSSVMERGGAVKFSFNADGLNIQGRGGINSADDVIDADHDCDGLEIWFNPKYVNEVMQRIEGDAVLKLGTSGDPALVNDSDDAAWLAVVMPMRA